MNELKLCPFCGGKASQEFFSQAGGGWSIFCDGCHASAATCVTKIGAIAAWNTRAIPDDVARIGEMRDKYDAAIALQMDMVRRAEMNAWQHAGELVVEAGTGVWARFCNAIDAARQALGR